MWATKTIGSLSASPWMSAIGEWARHTSTKSKSPQCDVSVKSYVYHDISQSRPLSWLLCLAYRLFSKSDCSTTMLSTVYHNMVLRDPSTSYIIALNFFIPWYWDFTIYMVIIKDPFQLFSLLCCRLAAVRENTVQSLQDAANHVRQSHIVEALLQTHIEKLLLPIQYPFFLIT